MYIFKKETANYVVCVELTLKTKQIFLKANEEVEKKGKAR